jgi:phosphoribosylanthranilate isomerase
MWVKVCGITNEQDAGLAVALGADALGFVFASGSSRQVTPAAAAEIIRRLPRETITVGVFRNERPERVAEIVSEVGLKGAQLHGREPLSEVRWVRKRVPFVIQAFNAGDAAIASAANGPADIVLIDSPGGGSGKVFDWSLAEGAPGGVRLLLAGGLNPENVAEAIRRVRPWGVDVSTGVEASRGKKDPKKLQRFIEAAKAIGEDILEEGRPEPSNGSRPFDWSED